MKEEWRDVVGYGGRYQVSNLGRVRSVDWYIVTRNQYRTHRRFLKGHLLVPSSDKDRYGHQTVSMSGKKNGPRSVHRLVLEAFVGPCPPGMEACHFPDRDPTNNRLDNLSWGTHKQNGEHMKAHGSLAGKKHSDETRARISASNIGKHSAPRGEPSEEHRRRLSAALTGRKFTEEHRNNLKLSWKRRLAKV